MFTIQDLMDQVECQGPVKGVRYNEVKDKKSILYTEECDGLNNCPNNIRNMELNYIYEMDGFTVYEV